MVTTAEERHAKQITGTIYPITGGEKSEEGLG
jgi:hypothetical protein